MSETNCVKCGAAFYPRHFYDPEKTKPMDTGYGTNLQDERVCFECCALEDLQRMREDGKISLYLTKKDNTWGISNWPGTLKIRVSNVRKGYHNIAQTRYDCWFVLDNTWWHGVQYGEWTQIVHCKKTKQQAGNIKSMVDLPESYEGKGFEA
jgi:hypothetical protein